MLERNPVCRLDARVPIQVAEGGFPVLPKIIRWALSLSEGDLLFVSPEEAEVVRLRFQSYGERVRGAVESCAKPWRFIEEALRLPMAAVGPCGALSLPEEAAALPQRSGDSLLLRAEVYHADRFFSLEPADGERSPELFLEAAYTLPVLPDFQISLPENLLWVLGIGEGDLLVSTSSLATAEFEPLTELGRLEGRKVVALGPGGVLSLPESLQRVLQTDARVRLTVFLSRQVALRVTRWVEI